MKQIVEEWCLFCEGSKNFEDGYFFTLFMEELSIEEIEKVFSFFPNSEKLLSKMLLFRETESNITLSNNELLKLLKKDFEERSIIFKEIPIFANLLRNPQFEYNENLEQVKSLIWDDIWSQEFYDHVGSFKIDKSPKVYELHNAMYGATYDFDMTLFLFEPLLKIDYSGQSLLKFKKCGGIYAIADNKIVFGKSTILS